MKVGTIASLAAGWQSFQSSHHPSRRQHYAALSEGQDPKVLFITCADSRIEPSFIFQSKPGEMFVARNPGNIVPPFGALLGGASASLEYALTALSVTDIIVCGHSDCGAMKGLLNKNALGNMPVVASWLRYAEAATILEPGTGRLSKSKQVGLLAKQNALVQLAHLKTYPVVAAGLANRSLNLHAWFYDIASGIVSCFEPESRMFLPLSPTTKPAFDRAEALVHG